MLTIKPNTKFSAVYLLTLVLMSCTPAYYPKPYGYFRVDLPENTYEKFDATFPCTFEKSALANAEFPQKNAVNLAYNSLNATIYCNYQPVDKNITALSEDARRAVYKHRVVAEDIKEVYYENPENKVYGTFYDLKGNVASVAQFVITDSVRHFFRGALYFNNIPNKDSIAPMADYIKKDIVHLMESFRWK